MNVMATPKMTVDEFLAWAEGRPGKYELFGGVVQQMSPERADHVVVKGSVWAALKASIKAAKRPCKALTDGMTVRVDAKRAFVPDAVVIYDADFDNESVEVHSPIVVVEVLSPSTAARDIGTKLIGYFSLLSVQHYLIIDIDDRSVVHHRRSDGEAIETRIIREGEIVLDPPGLTVSVASFFEDLH